VAYFVAVGRVGERFLYSGKIFNRRLRVGVQAPPFVQGFFGRTVGPAVD
jgi:hypothetical protein